MLFRSWKSTLSSTALLITIVLLHGGCGDDEAGGDVSPTGDAGNDDGATSSDGSVTSPDGSPGDGSPAVDAGGPVVFVESYINAALGGPRVAALPGGGFI